MIQFKNIIRQALFAASTVGTVEAAVLPEVEINRLTQAAGQAYSNAWRDVSSPALGTNFVAVNEQRLQLSDLALQIEEFRRKLKEDPSLVTTNSALVSLTLEQARDLKSEADRLKSKTLGITHPITSLIEKKLMADEIANESQLPRNIRAQALSISTNAHHVLVSLRTKTSIPANLTESIDLKWEMLSNEMQAKELVGYAHDMFIEKSTDTLSGMIIPVAFAAGIALIFATIGTIKSRSAMTTSIRRREEDEPGLKKKAKSGENPFRPGY